MHKTFTVLAGILAALALSGCISFTTIEVKPDGRAQIYQEIAIHGEELKAIPEDSRSSCWGILDWLSEGVDTKQMPLWPDRAEDVNDPEAHKAGTLICRFYSNQMSIKFDELASKMQFTEIKNGEMHFSMPKDLTQIFRDMIRTNTSTFGKLENANPYLLVRMPGKIHPSTSGNYGIIMNDTDTWFPLEDLEKAIVADSTLGDTPNAELEPVEPEPEEVTEPSKNAQPDSGVNLVTLGLLSGIMLVLAVIAVELFMFIHHRKRR